MKIIFIFMLAVLLLTGCDGGEELPELETTLTPDPTETVLPSEPELLLPLIHPEQTDFVRIIDYIPNVLIELKYAAPENFTGQIIYEFQDVFLRYGTVMKLKAVSEELSRHGLRLKVWDGFRPVCAQFKLWEVCPDDTYVADPNKGFSNHSRGFAVDVTIVDSEGREVEMPTAFDDFSAKADRDYSDCSETEASNARLLESIMEKHGFKGYVGEWWHFNDTDRYDVETVFDPGVISRQYAEEESALLKQFYDPDSVVLTIPAGEAVTILGYDEGFVLAEYWGYRGWIPMENMKKGM